MEGGHLGLSSKKTFVAKNARLQKIIQSLEVDEHVQDNNENDGYEDENAKILFLRSVARNIEFNLC